MTETETIPGEWLDDGETFVFTARAGVQREGDDIVIALGSDISITLAETDALNLAVAIVDAVEGLADD